MGKLASQFGAAPAAASPSSGGLPKGMVSKGGTFGTGGISIQTVNPEASAQETSATTNARISAEKTARQADAQQFLKSTTALGKPLDELTFKDIMDVTKGDMDSAKKYVDLKKSFAAGENVRVETVVPIIQNLLTNYLPKIPTLDGVSGRAMGYANRAKAAVGELPELTTYNNTLALLRPMLAKAMGNTGNLNETEQKTALMLLQQMATGTTRERQQAMDLFKFTMERAAGKKWGEMVGAAPKATVKDVSTQDLINALMPK